MASGPIVVLADSPDDSQFAAVGPVYSEEAALKLSLEIAAAGWRPTGVRRHLSRSAFRDLVAARQPGSTPAVPVVQLAAVPEAEETEPAAPDTRLAVDPDGKVKPVCEFTAEEKWWCEGEDCGGPLGASLPVPHVHPYVGPALAVDLLTGKEVGDGA